MLLEVPNVQLGVVEFR